MQRINYITNLEINTTSGGWGGINFNIYNQLNKFYPTNYIGPINPPFYSHEKVASKIQRLIGNRGRFSFFSNSRLEKISRLVEEQTSDATNASINFFFGPTPWIKYNSRIPYCIFMDATFSTYISIYHRVSEYSKKDIHRIIKQEEIFFQNAEKLFFMSSWPKEEAVRDYEIDPDKCIVSGSGGYMPIPEKDNYDDGAYLLFISLNFHKKGGLIATETFRQLRKKHKGIKLFIIGEKPPDKVLKIEGVEYKGYFNKSDALQLEVFKKILANAYLLIHPTEMDINPLVIAEAQYFGCPVIAPNRFGIPDLIKNNHNGFLIEEVKDAQTIVGKIDFLLEDKEAYLNMRKNAREYSLRNLTWHSVGERINDHIKPFIKTK